MIEMVYLGAILVLFRAAIQERNIKKLINENKDLKERLGR